MDRVQKKKVIRFVEGMLLLAVILTAIIVTTPAHAETRASFTPPERITLEDMNDIGKDTARIKEVIPEHCFAEPGEYLHSEKNYTYFVNTFIRIDHIGSYVYNRCSEVIIVIYNTNYGNQKSLLTLQIQPVAVIGSVTIQKAVDLKKS